MPSSSAPVQTPAGQVEIGFVGGAITGYIRANENAQNTGNTEYIPDEDGNDSVAVTSNRGVRFQVDGVVKAGTALPRQGDVVTVGGVAYIVESPSTRSTPGARRFSFTLYKPDATTWGAASGNS